MISFLSYFIVPTVLFLTFIKLNHRYRWIVKSHFYGGDYTLFGKHEIFSGFFWIYWLCLFVFWPIFLPISVFLVTIYGLCRVWATNGKSIIPEE